MNSSGRFVRARFAAPLIVFLLVQDALPTAQAEAVPVGGALDSRVRTVPYQSDQVYRLQTYVGYETELVFEEGEVFAGKGGGDLPGLTVDVHENHVLLKPSAVNSGANLVIFTNRRVYRFDYAVFAKRPDPSVDLVMYAVRFLYPPPPPKPPGALTPAQQVELDLARAAANRPRNIDYWFCGDSTIKPVAASDDGVHTRVKFDARAELPAIFVRNDDGSESLLNFSMDAGDVVIHRVARRFILRRGKITGCIINKGFAGSGERLSTGTVSTHVERDTKAPRP
jgi:type IV secretion system protein VirB9